MSTDASSASAGGYRLPNLKGLLILYLPNVALLFLVAIAALSPKITVASLTRDMAATAGKINQLLEHLGNDVIGNELENYRKELLELRQKAVQDLGNVNTAVAKHESELKLKLTEEMEAEKARLTQQIDTKLADAVAAFLVETLQHNVDLGAQTAYLNQMLEEHKDEFKKGVVDETETAG